jgi:hypothetical protein
MTVQLAAHSSDASGAQNSNSDFAFKIIEILTFIAKAQA